MIWGLILAVALEPLNARLAKRFGGRRGLAATVLTLVGLLLLGVPTVMLGSSFATHVQEVAAAAHDGTLHIPAPGAAVAEWPVVGKKIYAVWNSAATNLPAFVSENQDQLKDLSRKGLAAAASTAVAVLLFLGAMIIAAIMVLIQESYPKGIFDFLRGYARWTARMMLPCVPQRQRLGSRACRISRSVGFGVWSSRTLLFMIMPVAQKPHCAACSSMNAFWIGWGLSIEPSPSKVSIVRPSAFATGVTQERIAAPSMITVQAPHCARPQPNFGPFRPRSLRSTYKSGVSGLTSTVCFLPFTTNEIMMVYSSLRSKSLKKT
jgi:hypothetical protein